MHVSTSSCQVTLRDLLSAEMINKRALRWQQRHAHRREDVIRWFTLYTTANEHQYIVTTHRAVTTTQRHILIVYRRTSRGVRGATLSVISTDNRHRRLKRAADTMKINVSVRTPRPTANMSPACQLRRTVEDYKHMAGAVNTDYSK